MTSAREVTELLNQWAGGDQAAGERVLPLVYGELRRIARRSMKRQGSSHAPECGNARAAESRAPNSLGSRRGPHGGGARGRECTDSIAAPAPRRTGPLGVHALNSFADSATSPALSPDGRMLAFIQGEHTFGGPGQIYVKLLPNGEPVQLTHDDLNKRGSPKFSPDGARLAYAAFKPGSTWDTWVVPVLAGQPRLFLANRYGPPGVSWSPDGKFLYLNLQGSIYAIPLRPGQMLPIPASGFNRRKMWLPCRARG
jgi:hypothetical protein